MYISARIERYDFKKKLIKYFQAHGIDHMTPDMIKTKIMHGDDLPDPSVLPTTGRPVLVTPTGPISMRNMRKEPTQEELVSLSTIFLTLRKKQ